MMFGRQRRPQMLEASRFPLTRYSPVNAPVVATYCESEHSNSPSAPVTMVGASAGLLCSVSATWPGIFTSSRESQPLAITCTSRSATTALNRLPLTRRITFDSIGCMFVLTWSEAEAQGHDKTGRGRQYGLVVTGDLAVTANFRIPGPFASDLVHLRHAAVARRVETVMTGPQHHEVAAGQCHRTARCTHARHDRSRQRVAERNLTQLGE